MQKYRDDDERNRFSWDEIEQLIGLRKERIEEGPIEKSDSVISTSSSSDLIST